MPGHKLGDLVCPEVQAGRVLCHPRWSKFKDQYPHAKYFQVGKKGTGKSAPKKSSPSFNLDRPKGKGTGKAKNRPGREMGFNPGA